MKKESKTKAEQVRTVDSYMSEFAEKKQNAENNIKAMADLFVAAERAHGKEAAEKFAKRFRDISPNQWQYLRLIASGDAHPNIMFMSDRGAQKALKLLPAEQDKLLSKKTVKVIDGKTHVAKDVKLCDLTDRQVDALVDAKAGMLRDIDAQREFEKKRMEAAANAAMKPWHVEGQVIVVRRGCQIGLSEMREALVKAHGGNAFLAAAFVADYAKAELVERKAQ